MDCLPSLICHTMLFPNLPKKRKLDYRSYKADFSYSFLQSMQLSKRN